jgi:TRAP-type mannitol/chloroaromatic compound transport system substrate-binding protein
VDSLFGSRFGLTFYPSTEEFMKRIKMIVGLTMVLLMMAPQAFAQQTKFGVDKRRAEAQQELRTLKPSTETVRWRMVMPWSKGIHFYDMAQHFADSVALASGNRLQIRVFSAGELVGAMESFDAVSKGAAEIGHDWPGYWKGKNENFVSFGSVPFGLDNEGYNIWLYQRGGLEQMQELYGRYNLVAFPVGNGGQEMGFYSNKRATKMEDFKGMRLRTVGWYMDIMNSLGASVTPLPGGEIYLALERGVIDGAEFSTPAMNVAMGFDQITKYVLSPGVHQPSVQCAIFINKQAWEKLPRDLQWIVKIAAQQTQLWSNHWQENLNMEAIALHKKKVEFVKMDDDAITAFAKQTKSYLDELKAKHPDVKKTLDSQEQFKKDFAEWREIRSGLTPWPLDDFIEGKRLQ